MSSSCMDIYVCTRNRVLQVPRGVGQITVYFYIDEGSCERTRAASYDRRLRHCIVYDPHMYSSFIRLLVRHHIFRLAHNYQ